MAELRDLYDKNRQLTGQTIRRDQPTPPGCYILVVMVFIQNSEGKFLIQKRSQAKGGYYASTGGHAKSGENSIQAMRAEIAEELGLELSEKDLQLFYAGRSDEEQVFYDDYYYKADLNLDDLTLQKSEVDSVQWLTKDEIEKLNAENDFSWGDYEEFQRLQEWLKTK